MIKRTVIAIIAVVLFSSGYVSSYANNISDDNIPYKVRKATVILHHDKEDKHRTSGISYFTGKSDTQIYLDEGKDVDTLTISIDRDISELCYKTYNYKQYTFLIHKNDTIEIKFKRGIPVVTSTFNEQKPLDYSWEQIYNKKYLNKLEPFHLFKLYQNKKKKIVKYIDKYPAYLRLKREFLNDIYSKGDISDAAYQLYSKKLDIEINGFLANAKVQLYSKNSVKPEDIFNDDYLIYEVYRQFIKDHMFDQSGVRKIKAAKYDMRVCFDWLAKENKIPQLSKAYLMINTMVTISFFCKDQDFMSRLEILKKSLPDNRYDDNIANLTPKTGNNKSEIKSSDELWVTDNNGNKSKFNDILVQNRGKVICIDFWATWCGPCCKGIPYMNKLREEYADKGVVFIYLSIWDKEWRWKDRLTDFELKEYKHSYFAQNAATSKLINDLQIKSIPRYVIIDKTGTIAEENAPGPKDKKLKKVINKYLEK
ncbi:MAG: redoxin family protein [Bacteroidales bacterium]|jgi:thiol-disulfide isomerase/thioredoxin|nr:redoxin family protein [Bacteroidales bacterium]